MNREKLAAFTTHPATRRVALAFVGITAAALVLVGVIGAALVYGVPNLGLATLAVLGAAGGFGAILTAPRHKESTIPGAIVTAALLAFAAFALVAPAVFR